GKPGAAASHGFAARPNRSADRNRSRVAAPRCRAGLALGIGRYRGSRGTAGAPAAARRPAGHPRQARQKRFRSSIPDRYPRREAMTGTVWDTVGAIPDDESLRRAIRQRVEAAGTSFYWAMRLLSRDRRDGMYAIYAFCREVDDIADDSGPPASKQAALAEWHSEIDALYDGRP